MSEMSCFVPVDTEIYLMSSSELKLYRAGVNNRFLYPFQLNNTQVLSLLMYG